MKIGNKAEEFTQNWLKAFKEVIQDNIGFMSFDFERHEFACHCGCGFDAVDHVLLLILQDLRCQFGEIIINSGCRCEAHNLAVGGSHGSQHTKGMAADFHSPVREATPYQIVKYLEKLYPNQYGIGRYEDYVHLDVKPGGARRWHGKARSK